MKPRARVPWPRATFCCWPSQEGNGVEYRYDNTIPDARTARIIADRAIQIAAGRRDPVAAANRLVHETGSRYIDFVVPGLLGMNLMGSAMWGLGFAIVNARAKKLLKRMVASPMPRWQYLASYLLSRLVMLAIEVVLLLGFARAVFRRALSRFARGAGLICVLASLTFSALGLLVASRARTIEAVSGLMNVVMMPMWIMSGVFFSPSRFPAILQPFIQALPLTAAINAVRGNMLQGTGLGHMMPSLAILLAWFLVPFAVAVKIFRWK